LPTLFASQLPVRKKRSRLTATATAAGGFVILAAIAVIGGFAYDSHLNKQYQALASAAPPLAAPSPTPPAPFEESAADQAAEPITVVVNSPAQSDASDQRQSREPSQINNGSQSAPPALSVPFKEMTPSLSPVPPRVSLSSDNRAGAENQIPLGVPADVPIGPTHPAEPPPKIVRRSQGVVLGSAVKRVDPMYPSAAKEARQSGVVVVEVTISEQGNVTSTRAVSGPALLRNAAVAAARGWKFKPSTLGGVPVTTTTTIAFNFKL
jgi:protein TonB